MPIGHGQGGALDLKGLFDVGQNIERRFALAVELVDKGQNGGVAQAADLHQFTGLSFDPLDTVDHHYRAVYRGQDPIGVF
jgi:hypothetical protein